MRTTKLTRRQSEILLAAVISARATSMLFSKIVLAGMDVFNLMALRSLIAFALLIPLFHRQLRASRAQELRAGIIMGALFFLTMATELASLRYAPTSAVAFLQNTAIVIVPFLQAVLTRRKPERKAITASLICLAGVALLTLAGSTGPAVGIILALASAFFYAFTIIATDRLSHSGIDSLSAGILQVGAVGILSLAASFLFESPHLPQGTASWACILVLAIVCSGFGFTLQPVAQSGTSAEAAGLLCALNPLVASVLGVVFLHEQMSAKAILGGALVLAGILLYSKKEKGAAKE
ncbi:MAG: DMT family transporter [Clostridia bacterium]|nr:DMT family transporter [Clostridia bacterium]